MNDFFDAPIESGSEGGNLYFKPEKGENKLRILTKAKVGWEGWYNNKPVRFKHDFKPSADEYDTFDVDDYNKDRRKFKQFACTLVWNYTTDSVQIWTFNQKSIINEIIRLAADADWGPITSYDIKLTREEGDIVKYFITPLPAKELTNEQKATIEKFTFKPEDIFTDEKNQNNISDFKAGVETAKSKADDLTDSDSPF